MDDAFNLPDQSTSHVLRPHHVGVLTVILLMRSREPETYSHGFQLHLHRALLIEISDITEPRPYPQFIRDIAAYSPTGESLEVRRLATTLAGLPRHLHTAEKFADFFNDIHSLIMDGESMERRSLFGLFARRCYFTFLKMNFESVDKLRHEFYTFATNQGRTIYLRITVDEMHDRFLLHSVQDERRESQYHDFQLFEKDVARGDRAGAEAHLRDFFIQRFTDTKDSPVRQIALLHLGQLHVMWAEWDAARKVLLECISVCRSNGDKVTLNYSTLLLRRLPAEPIKEDSTPVLTIIQEHTPALEVLYDVKKLIDAGQSLSLAFERLVEATASADVWTDKPDGRPPPSLPDCQWANHAVQAIVWRAAGQEILAQTEENITMSFAKPYGDDDAFLSACLGRARQYARQGEIETALVTLLDPPTWAPLNLRQYNIWAAEVWNVLIIHLARKGQKRQFDEYFKTRQPVREETLKAFFEDASGDRQGKLQAALQQCMDSRRLSAGPMGLEPVLKALGAAKASGQWGLYRVAVIMLVDLELELGLTSTSRETLEECLPQIMLGEDVEQRAYACFTFARCLLVEGKGSALSLQQALPFLHTAETDYKQIQLHAALERTQYMLAVVLHNLGEDYHAQRNEAARKRLATAVETVRWATEPLDEQFKQAMDLVMDVGTLLASRS